MKKIEFFLKNILLRILLKLKHTSIPSQVIDTGNNSKILFIRLNRIGDALVTTPFIHFIKSNLNAKIYVLSDEKNKTAYQNNPDIDELLVFKKGLKGFLDILRLIKIEQIETVVDLHDDVSATVSFLIALCSANNKFGLEKENKLIYSKTVARLDASKFHVVERIMELSKLFNLRVDYSNIKIHFHTGINSGKKADDFITNNYSDKKYFIGMNISAGSNARFWGVENYKKLLNYFASLDVNLAILSSPRDLELTRQIANSNFKFFVSETFSDFAAMISKLDFLFTPDTAAIHLASAYNVPTFGVYVKYKTNDMIWSPYNTKFDCVITEDENLSRITFDEVISKLKPFLENTLSEYNVFKQS